MISPPVPSIIPADSEIGRDLDANAIRNSRIVYASFYTPEYAEEAAGLRHSFDECGIPSDRVQIEPRASRGTWAKNCAGKPQFLRDVIATLRDGDQVIWVDADARIDVDPTPYFLAIPDSVDLGIHWRAGEELLTGTLYLRVGDGVRILLGAWIDACDANPTAWDQRVLQRIIHGVINLVVVTIPPSFCAIPDLMPGVHPIIRHRQASRRLKMLVGP